MICKYEMHCFFMKFYIKKIDLFINSKFIFIKLINKSI
uniref:Uncharacterized protein n=1 Tax=Siphoviridae sp. ctl0E3 TaxID=2827586 RepID=A0A8S5LNR6_9CAUD|nr:MAG TPA: hypothetical protein [Siphoviridae sp. ctl0E3]DAO04984.1 MAG TPA: hypothetical protein [Caudoviricetes sp.]DAR53833.1 MAG TPA: hypothetical protein [Caudoviricetes sp.]